MQNQNFIKMNRTISNSRLQQQEHKLNQILLKVSECVNKKISDPKKLNNHKNMFRATQPKNLKGGMLKDYQKQALVWMIQLAFKKMNGILADDMGLGKTIQTIAYLAYLKQEHGISGKHMIVAPLTVVNNWKREINKWFPALNVVILWATEAQRQQIVKTIIKPRNFDILITSYQGVVNSFKALRQIVWEVLVVDEAHKIKNDQAMITEIVKQYRANFKLLLTGTPLSNNLRELWSLLNFIMPQIFYDRQLFDQIQQGIKFYDGSQNQKFQIQCKIAKKFHGIIRPFIMRRTKKDTDLGLPPKTQHTLFVSMSKLQLKMYRNFLKYKSVFGQNGPRQTGGQIATRKICNHPYLFHGIQGQNSPQFGEHLIENCGKMIVLDKLLNKLILIEKRKVLIFSQFKIQMNILEDYFSYRNFNYFRLDGDTSIEERQQMMADFNNDREFEVPIFILSTRAGGLGINLVAASVVIIYDIDWNPQNDSQAMDRAYRIGQTRPVNVYKMVTQHTIEQRMLEVQKYKLIWDQLVIQKGAVINMKNQDVLAGLNYEKIANMKKGEIFKIQATKDNRTIDQIIQMGEIKDEGKYKEIKEKILKQIEQQKTHQNFNANPFQDNEFIDQEGDKMVKHYSGQIILDKARGRQMDKDILKENMTKIRKKNLFLKSINLPEHHLYENPQQIKQLMFQIQNKKLSCLQFKEAYQNNNQKNQNRKQLQLLEQQLEQLEQKLNDTKAQAFIDWEQDQYKCFIEQQINQVSPKANNLQKLHDLIPNKSIQQIKIYKDAFYNRELKNLPKIIKTRKEVLKKQKDLKTNNEKSLFHKALMENDAVYIKKTNNSLDILINNLRIESGIQNSKQFFESQTFLQNTTLNELRKVMGQLSFQKDIKDNILSSKHLLQKFYKTSNYQDAVQKPQNKEFLQHDFTEKRIKVVEQLKRKVRGLTIPKSNTKTQNGQSQELAFHEV